MYLTIFADGNGMQWIPRALVGQQFAPGVGRDEGCHQAIEQTQAPDLDRAHALETQRVGLKG